KIVHDELTALMGTGDSRLAFGRPPTTILLAGLQGSGKTTAAAKLALMLRKEGRKPGLVAADLQRPAAIDQLEQLGRQIGVPVYREDTEDPVEVVKHGLERLAVDGVILTKLDGDARGGAALSVRAVTGKPIKFVGTGEKVEALESFHPDRMASRILGMGDVLSLIERAEAAIEEDEKDELERRMMAGEFTFDDFLKSYKMLRRMGPLQGVLKLIPGLGKQLEGLDQVDERHLARVEAVILSMTPRERRLPHVIDGSRRQRIAKGSGTGVEQ